MRSTGTYQESIFLKRWHPDQRIEREPFAHVWKFEDFGNILRVGAQGELLTLVKRRAIQTGIEEITQQSLV